MRIISQDNEVDVPYENVVLYISHLNDESFIIAESPSGTDYHLGRYETLEEAKKVFDEIYHKWRHGYECAYLGVMK